MGLASSSRRGSSSSRESNLPRATPSRSSTSYDSSDPDPTQDCVLSSFSISGQDVSVPIENWLSMDTTSREKRVQHAKHCILTPYFLFSKEDEYNGKVVSWLRQKLLIPKQSEFKLLSDQHITVADCAEQAVDMILSFMNSSCFLYDVFHVVEQTKECRFLSDALTMAKNCKLVEVLLSNFTKFLPGNKLPRDDIGFIILVLLNQAMNHIQKVGDQTEAFEQGMKDNNERCDVLKLKGNSLFNAKKYSKACGYYSQAIKLRPFDAVLYGNRAQSYLSSSKYREALSDARRAICLNPSWEKGYFRYAKAYYHLGFHDRAIAINLRAQQKCRQTAELIRQAAMFSQDRRPSPSPQPISKRQCITSIERQGLSSTSVEEKDEYLDLPELIPNSDEEEDRPWVLGQEDGACGINKEKMEIEDSSCKRIHCSCSRCSPRNAFSTRLRRASDRHHSCDDDDETINKNEKGRTLLKNNKGKNTSQSGATTSTEACSSSSSNRYHIQDDADELQLVPSPRNWRLSWNNEKGPSVNHHHMCVDADDTTDCNCLEIDTHSDAQTKPSRTTSVKDGSRSSSNHHHISPDADDKNSNLSSLDNGSESRDTGSKPSVMTSSDLLSDDCDCDDCGFESSSSRLNTEAKSRHSEGSKIGIPTNTDTDDDSKDDDDDDGCVCGFCSLNGDDDDNDDDDDDNDEWEDIDDDDDEMDFPDLIDHEPSDDDEDEEDNEDDDDDDDGDLFFNPFFHMFESMVPNPPLPPQLIFGSEILLLALIRQFIEDHSEFQSEDTPPGALPEVIDSLIKKKVSKDLIESSASCCICQNDYVLDEFITCLPCNHVYHGPCISTWLKMHATCPTCRDVLPH